MENLFAYGTLMCEDIMTQVSGVRLTHVPGFLKGYGRRSVSGEQYPALVPDENGRVEGVLYLNVPGPAWDRLDRFEGEMYARQRVVVEQNDGVVWPAETYVVRPEFRGHLDSSDWDFALFLRTGKDRFMKYYKGYQSI